VSYKPWSSTTAAPEPPLDRPVQVDLEAFWVHPMTALPGLTTPCRVACRSRLAACPDYSNAGRAPRTATGSSV
jgi:hypothetical protein